MSGAVVGHFLKLRWVWRVVAGLQALSSFDRRSGPAVTVPTMHPSATATSTVANTTQQATVTGCTGPAQPGDERAHTGGDETSPRRVPALLAH
jgi:hypothetical protein